MVKNNKFNWTMTLTNSNTGFVFVWRSKNIRDLLRYAMEYFDSRRAHNWSEEADNYLLANYHVIGSRACALGLAPILGRTLTRRAVIGRYHRLLANAPQFVNGPDNAIEDISPAIRRELSAQKQEA